LLSRACKRVISPRALTAGWVFAAALPALAANHELFRVCADPNNLPFSNQAREGFENRVAEIVAGDIDRQLEFVWRAERKNFIDSSLGAGACDAVMGVPAGLKSVDVTEPWYRSTYVFVQRRGTTKPVSSLNDTALESMRIGIHVVDGDYAPPAQLLARRGLSANLVGFSLYGREGEPNPPARLVEAAGRGDIDIAIAWGPLAGYFARNTSLAITPVTPQAFAAIPFTYAIATATRKGDTGLRDKLNQALKHECAASQNLLHSYGVPQIVEDKPPCVSAPPVSASLR
jgi:mxaJ protein